MKYTIIRDDEGKSQFFDAVAMNESPSIGEAALSRPEYGGHGNQKTWTEHARTLSQKWVDVTKDNVKGRMIDIQILVTAILPPDLPRLFFVMARTIPFGLLCKAPKIPAILKALDNLVMTTVTANPPAHLAVGLTTFSRNQQRQGFTITALVVLAWVLEQRGANNDLVARNEVLTIRFDGAPGRDNLLRELAKANSYLCDCNPDIERANKLCGQVNQPLVMHGRTVDENMFKKAFREFNENCEIVIFRSSPRCRISTHNCTYGGRKQEDTVKKAWKH